MFCSNDLGKSKGEEIFEIPRWPIELPANPARWTELAVLVSWWL